MRLVDESDDRLEALVTAVRSSRKHRHICPGVVRRVGAGKLAAHPGLKKAIKATKRKLHQVGAAYLPRTMLYSRWLGELREAAQSGGEKGLREACARIMAHHASTRERLPILGRFYRATLSELAPVRSVLDVGCGLHPLAIPWMPLAQGASYFAVDMYADLVGFLGEFMALVEVRGRAEALDVLGPLPSEEVELAFLLKTLPCLEQLEPGVGRRLIESIPARHLLVSFPVRSLGGRQRGMLASYEARFREVAREDWAVRRLVFDAELTFLVSK